MTTATTHTDAANGATASSANPEEPLSAVQAPTVPRSRIVVQFNPRLDFDGGRADLRKSMAERGLDFAITVRPGEGDELIVVDGERRLREADELGWTEIPIDLRADMTEIEAVELALSSAHHRRSLTPCEEARGFAKLIELGKSKRSIAKRYGVSQKYVTMRLELLKLPEAVQAVVGTDAAPLSTVPELCRVAGFSPALVELIACEVTGPIDPESAMYAVSGRQGTDGLWPTSQIDVSKLDLDPAATEKVALLTDHFYSWAPQFTDEELDRANAAGVLYADHDETGYGPGVICDTEMATEMVLAVLDREMAEEGARLERSAERQAQIEANQSRAETAREAEKAKRRKQRVRDQKIAKQARAANLDLGRRLAEKVKVEGLDKGFVQLCAYTILGQPASYSMGRAAGAYSVAELAGAGLRLVLEGWQTVEILKNKKTKVHYVGSSQYIGEQTEELATRFWDWFEKAKTAEEMAKRLVIALAAADYAVAEALPMSRRIASPLRKGRDDKALKALKRLTRGCEPPTLKQVRHEIANPGDDDAPASSATVTPIAPNGNGGAAADEPATVPAEEVPIAA